MYDDEGYLRDDAANNKDEENYSVEFDNCDDLSVDGDYDNLGVHAGAHSDRGTGGSVTSSGAAGYTRVPVRPPELLAGTAGCTAQPSAGAAMSTMENSEIGDILENQLSVFWLPAYNPPC